MGKNGKRTQSHTQMGKKGKVVVVAVEARKEPEGAKEQKKKKARETSKELSPSRSFPFLSLTLSRATIPLPRASSREAPAARSKTRRSLLSSDAGRIEHHPHRRAERRRREVLGELGPDGARPAVRPRDAAPDDAELGAALEGLGLVDVGKALFLFFFCFFLFWLDWLGIGRGCFGFWKGRDGKKKAR